MRPTEAMDSSGMMNAKLNAGPNGGQKRGMGKVERKALPPLAEVKRHGYSAPSPLRSGDVGEWLKPTVC